MKYRIKYRIILYLSFSCFLFSCARASEKLLILEGNFLFSQHRYNDAIESYHRALAHEETAPYAESGLGSVYYSLDENKAALQRLEDSQNLLAAFPPAAHRELRYRNSYNLGVIHFTQGDFSAAAEDFRQALRHDSGRVEAKRNLELSLLSAAKEKTARGRPEETEHEIEGKAALFEYFRQKEQNQWKNRERAADKEDMGPEY